MRIEFDILVVSYSEKSSESAQHLVGCAQMMGNPRILGKKANRVKENATPTGIIYLYKSFCLFILIQFRKVVCLTKKIVNYIFS